MKWNEIQKHYPERWVLVEVVSAHSEEQMRVPDDMRVLQEFNNSHIALQQYKNEHHKNPFRELVVLHTSREKLDIEERHWVGIRIKRGR